MRLLFFQNFIHPAFGGVERVTSILASFFSENGIECFRACQIDDELNDVPADHKFVYNPKDNDELDTLIVPFIKDHKIDIIINQGIVCENFTNLRKRLRKQNLPTKVIAVFHLNPNQEKYKKYSLKTRLKQWAIWLLKGYYKPQRDLSELSRSVDRYVLLSKSYEGPVKRRFSLYKKLPLSSINNPLSFAQPEYPDWDSRRRQFLMVTRMDDTQKNLMSALRIWKKFEQRNEKYSLVIAGDGADYAKVCKYAESLELQRLTFLGQVADPQPLYAQSRYYMMTSRYEGWGMSMVESLQYGCIPIAMNSYSAVKDIITDRYNGFLVASGDEDAYVKTMLQIIADEGLQKKMSKAAYDSAERFDVEKIGREWMDLFDELLSKK